VHDRSLSRVRTTGKSAEGRGHAWVCQNGAKRRWWLREHYTANEFDKSVSQYDVDPLTGVLSPKTPATVAAGRKPSRVAVTPDGKHAYVTNQR
jgi:hypothetical protein